jgi:hypothetical protein
MSKTIRSVILLFVLGAIWIPCAFAETAGDGYAFFSLDEPEGASLGEAVTVGLGGDALFYKGFGAGFDLGYLFPRRSVGDGIGLVSLNGAYHLKNRIAGGRFEPFAIAGYGLAFRSGHLNLYDLGGGAIYWFSRHLGVRIDLRDYRSPRYGEYDFAFRFGLAIH